MASVPDTVKVTNRRIQRRHAERSVDALWDRICAIPEPPNGDRSAIQGLVSRWGHLALVRKDRRDHTWEGDFDSLELRVRRAEATQ